MKLKEALITCVVCSVCLTPLLVNGETKIDADHCKESIVNIDTIVKSGKSFNSKYNQGMEDYKNSDEYKLKVQKEKLQNQLGIKIKKLVPITFEVSYYTSLNQENGYGAITATGDDLEDGFVANNHLSFGTKIIVDGKLKTVMDRGSSKYFSNSNAIDVFVPKWSNESESECYDRVNNMGRHYKKGYIIVEE